MLDDVLKKNEVSAAKELVSDLFSWIDDEIFDITRDVDSGKLSNIEISERLEELRKKIY